jgi:hypothetical protein
LSRPGPGLVAALATALNAGSTHVLQPNVLQPGPTPAERTKMSHLQVVRWARFGHDRLYVKTLAGVQLGYWDNNGHVACLEDEANRPMFDEVIAEYHSGRTNGPALAGASSGPVTVVEGAPPVSEDITAIRSGIVHTGPGLAVPVPAQPPVAPGESPESAAEDVTSDHPAAKLSVSELLVVRWVHFGHDRLYVKTPTGVQLGYWDNKGEVAFLENEADRPTFDHAIAQYRSGRPDGRAPASTSSDPVTVDQGNTAAIETGIAHTEPRPNISAPAELPPTTPEWADMSVNPAGASCRQRADALRQAAPVRTFLARCLGRRNEERAWRIGADGEEAVAAQLAKLGDRWRTVHAVTVGNNGSDIDHVIIGPAGIYTINTKNRPNANIWVGGNTFMVNGQRVPYVRNARFEAKRTKAFLATATGLDIPVTGLIAVVGAHGGYKIKEQPPGGDVYVLARKELVKWLHRRPQTLTDTQVGTLFLAARRSTTWQR